MSGAWDDPYWAGRITPRETPETLEVLELAANRGNKERGSIRDHDKEEQQ